MVPSDELVGVEVVDELRAARAVVGDDGPGGLGGAGVGGHRAGPRRIDADVRSVDALERAKNTPGCIYMRPPIDGYGTLEFSKFDEIYAVEFKTGRWRTKKSFGTAMKLWGGSGKSNFAAYAKLAIVAARACRPGEIMHNEPDGMTEAMVIAALTRLI